MAEVIYKILIADDEYWTRENIRNMIDWEEYHLKFLEPAENGKEALKKIEEEKPDILITDINMPFINGVELIKTLKEQYPDIVIFVISGYDDFEYVKSALMSGAINYLLKPVTKIDLVNALSKALEIKSSEDENKTQVLKASSLIQDRELSLFLEERQTLYSPTLIVNPDIDFAGQRLILIKIHSLKELMAKYDYDMNLLSYSVKRKIREIIGQNKLFLFNNIHRSNEFIIISELEYSEQKKMMVMILNELGREISSPISIVISEQSYSIESIHTAYIQTVSMLMTRKYKRDSIILYCKNDRDTTKKDIKPRISEENEKMLKSLIKSRNLAASRAMIFETIGISHCEEQEWEYLEVRQTVKRICNIIMNIMADKASPNEIMEIENLIELADKTIENLLIHDLCEILEEILLSVMNLQKEEYSGTIRDVVKQAVKYIETNFFEELTLTEIADRFGVESSYFSKMFRKETGYNMMLYIAKLRIEKAKEYMNNSNINLTEIAFMVGYDDYTYFSKVFRKMTGQSPRDYRNSIDQIKQN